MVEVFVRERDVARGERAPEVAHGQVPLVALVQLAERAL